MSWWQSLKAFNINALNNIVYLFINNLWFFLMVAALMGIIVLQLKEEVSTAVRDEQNII